MNKLTGGIWKVLNSPPYPPTFLGGFMKKTFFIIAIIILGGIVYLNTQEEKKEENTFSPYKRFNEMQKEILKLLRKNDKIDKNFFDSFFDDDFFSGKYDPFKEIIEIHKNILESMEEERKKIFKDSWDEWYKNRIGMEDIKITQSETDKEIILELAIPDKNAQIQIKQGFIKISYDKITTTEQEKNGSKLKSYSRQKISKILSIPENADPEKHKIEFKDEKILIKFGKKSKNEKKI